MMHGNMYRHSDMTKEVDPNIEGVKKASYDMARLHPASKGVNLVASDEVMSLINSLCKKIMKFLNDARHER